MTRGLEGKNLVCQEYGVEGNGFGVGPKVEEKDLLGSNHYGNLFKRYIGRYM